MDQPKHVVKEHHANGQVKQESWRVDGECHRLDGPAYIQYFPSGQVARKEWYVNGEYHRLDGPAWVEYHDNGQVAGEYWYVNGVNHRLDGPASIRYHANGQVEYEYWYVNGLNHRLDGPARVWYHDNGQVANEFWYYEDQKVTPEFIQQKRLEQAPALAYIDGVKLVEVGDQYYLIFGNEVEGPVGLEDGLDRLQAMGKVQYAKI